MVKVSRRDFLKGAAAAGVSIYGGAIPTEAQSAPGKSKVVILTSPRIFVNPKENPNTIDKLRLPAAGAYDATIDMLVLKDMVNKGVEKLTGKSGDAAWKSLFKPTDVVGIKVNCLFGKQASTRPETVAAVISGLIAAGVKKENIIVWDWRDQHLIKCGYWLKRDGEGILCYATEEDVEEQSTKVDQFNGKLSKILTQKITALVNVPILKDHGNSGITCSMKNHYGSHHNPYDHHGNNCDPYIAELNSIPAIKDKTRLIVCEALRPLADGGPGLNRDMLWEHKSILVGKDPVALDYQAWQIIEARRKEIGLKPLAESGREPKWIATAAKLGVGTNDPSRMDVIRVTV